MVHQRVPHRLTGVKTVAVERLLPSLDDILSAVESAPDIGALAVVTPGLPHGGYQSMEEIRFLAEKARQEGWILVVDETLAGLAYEVEAAGNWSWLDQSHPVVRIASISKTFGLAGVRIGYFSATEAASHRPDTGEDLFERAADMADTAYSAPPAVLGMVLEAGLEILEKSRSGRSADPDVARYAGNIERLKRRAQRAAEILAEWDISCVVPQAGASLMACLGALSNCERDAEPFFRSLLTSHSLFLELGGHFSQNPEWNFTVARLGLARNETDFELDLVTFCRFYETYARKSSRVSLAGQES
jgi:aspartate/methionine/tyrosine aminotransferase